MIRVEGWNDDRAKRVPQLTSLFVRTHEEQRLGDLVVPDAHWDLAVDVLREPALWLLDGTHVATCLSLSLSGLPAWRRMRCDVIRDVTVYCFCSRLNCIRNYPLSM